MIKVKNVSTFVGLIRINFMKSILKKGLYLFSISALVGLMFSCLGGDDYTDTFPLTDAELLSFHLSHDSLPALGNVVFTINQNGSSVGEIYNKDSMAYMTVLPEKVLINYISGAGIDNVQNITNGDSIWLKTGDSIDFSFPQTLKVFALDGVNSKTYITKLNIHQVDPDSLQYVKIASGLSFLKVEETKTVTFNDRFLTYSRIDNKIQVYSSLDAENWTYLSESGLPNDAVIREIKSSGTKLFAFTVDGKLYVRHDISADIWILVDKPSSIKIKSILGYFNESHKQKEGLSLVIETDGKYTFAFTDDFIVWQYDSSVSIPADFPLYDFSSISRQVMLTERITIFGGASADNTVRNAVWSTENGIYWAKLTGVYNVFPPVRGANVFSYNKEFWLVNGQLDNIYNDKIYFSIDGGVTWKVKFDSDYISENEESSENLDDNKIPDIYPLRYNASVVTDKDNKYFYIIGGKQDEISTEVWKGFLNKMEFKQ